MLELRIGVAGNCVAGKSTLVNALIAKGYNAVNIAQEHSVSKRFWMRLKPDFIVYLSCNLDTARQRRKIGWGQERLTEQWAILSDVKANADIILETDQMTKEEVLAKVEQALSNLPKERRN